MADARRLLGNFPQLTRRSWEDAAPELERFLRRMFDSENDGLPAGFKGTTPTPVGADNSDPGLEAAGWASGTHEHQALTGVPVPLGLYDAEEGTGEALSRHDHVHPHTHLDDDLTAMFRFEETSGDRLSSVGDYALKENNAPVAGAVGKLGGAVQTAITGSKSLYLAAGTDLQQGSFDYSICGWAYFDSVATEQYIVSKAGAVTDREYSIYYDPTGDGGLGSFKAMLQTDTPTEYVVEATDINPVVSTWYFFHFWYDHDAAQIFLRINDGTTFATAITAGAPYVSASRLFQVGATNDAAPAGFFDGRIDALHWHHRNLTEAEHLNMWNDGDGREVYPEQALTTSLITHGGTIYSPTLPLTANTLVWEAPFPCEVVALRARREGGTGATVNMRKNGSLDHLAADLSLTGAGVWTDGGAVQNIDYNVGDSMEMNIRSLAGSPSQVAILARLLRTG